MLIIFQVHLNNLGSKRKAEDESKENEENNGESTKQKKQKRKSDAELTYKISKTVKECYVMLISLVKMSWWFLYDLYCLLVLVPFTFFYI